MEKIREYLSIKKGEMLHLLERLVNIDSGSYCKEGIDSCGQILAEELRALGFKVEVIREKDSGNHVWAERSGKGGRRLFLSGHLDTLRPYGTVARFPFHADGNFAYGPGVGDMKGGLVQLIYSLKALQDLGRETPQISVFLTGDEELGSVKGRPYIEKESRRSNWALIMESSVAPEIIVVRRWGVGAFYLVIHGKAAHVLDQNMAGVNACSELALKILTLENLSDIHEGVKVSVNLVHGGTSRQVTASEARADIDVRVRDAINMEKIEEKVRKIAETSILQGVRIELKGGLTRPPMEPNQNTEIFFNLAKEVGYEIGMNLNTGMKAGGSDGCFTSALGVATLDGMGPLCYDLCSETERIELNDLISKGLLTAGIIQRLAKEA